MISYLIENAIHVFVDTETTGLGHVASPPRGDAVVEIGIAYRAAGVIVTRDWLCNPGAQYLMNGRASEALLVSHIKEEDILSSRPAVRIAKNLKNEMRELEKDTALPLVWHAYNIPFDRGFLEKSPWNLKVNWGEDVMDIAKSYFGLPDGYRISLAKTMEHLGIIPNGQPHRAVTDALSAMLAYEFMRGRQ